MTRPRILQVSTWNTPCGIATYTADLIRALSDQGVECDVEAIDRALVATLARKELRQYFEDMASRAKGYDIVHVQHEFGFFSGSYGMPESIDAFASFLTRLRRYAPKVAVTFHSLPPIPTWHHEALRSALREGFLWFKWRREVVPFFSRPNVLTLAPSQFLRRSLVDSGIPRSLVRVIPQGSQTAMEPESDKGIAKNEVGLDEQTYVAALFGFVTRNKGHHVALEALRHLPDQFHLVIVGGPPPQGRDPAYDSVLEFRRKFQLLRHRIHVTGFLPSDEAAAYLRAADVCLAPYLDVASSAAVMWALASGAPLIASRISAFAELNQKRQAAYLVTPNAPAELADAILKVSRDTDLKKKLVTNALDYCREHSWDQIARAHIDAYSTIGQPPTNP
ncbi:MAG TPA: glycosyltransferase [Actinomycetota bacterium]|nr:glycosyltransferase [Actinomycetota bacterium]